jgi:hypothetical protein
LELALELDLLLAFFSRDAPTFSQCGLGRLLGLFGLLRSGQWAISGQWAVGTR